MSSKKSPPSSRKAPLLATTETSTPKVTKKRATKACAMCRHRKVRCDVTERFPCGNCRHEDIDCVIVESKRRKKPPQVLAASTNAAGSAEAQPSSASGLGLQTAYSNKSADGSASDFPMSGIENSGGESQTFGSHVPHSIYQRSAEFLQSSSRLRGPEVDNARPPWTALPLLHPVPWAGGEVLEAYHTLPEFIKPLPKRIVQEDVRYLGSKGALMLPKPQLRVHLLRAYVEFVHPFMPVLDLHDFLDVVNSEDGKCGQVSLLLYHAVMFAATAFVEGEFLREAGFRSRREMRKIFFQKARLLYDFDYETDRLVLVQALLLMTYWYETPDDQKDTWHWMGIAISLAHTIGLNNNLTTSAMSPKSRKLRRRVWWSCFMRDRLVALGMRRPTRLKDEDFDVPMLEEGDFDLQVLSHENRMLPQDCTVVRDISMQRELAQMCVQKAKLCVLISRMLKAQYSVLNRYAVMNKDPTQFQSTESSTMMLFPNKTLDNLDEVRNVDHELHEWLEGLPKSCSNDMKASDDIPRGRTTMVVQRSLLHMVYHTTMSALHRPLILPASQMQEAVASRQTRQTLDMSRMRVHNSAEQVTKLVMALAGRKLERYLPTTGVTVILPTMIIHLFSMKDHDLGRRARARQSFLDCMKVMVNLCDIYAAAEFGAHFLNTTLQNASVDVNEPESSKTQARIALMSKTTLGLGLNLRPNGSASGGELAGLMREPMPYSSPLDQNLFQQPMALDEERAGDAAVPNGMDHSTPPSHGYSRSTDSWSETGSTDGDAGIDWKLGGMDFDIEQWMQFPAEGLPPADGALFLGLSDKSVNSFNEPQIDVSDYMDFQNT